MPDPTPGTRLTMLPRELVNRVAQGLRGLVGGGPPQSAPNPPQKRDPWFGPGQPMAPQAPPQDVAGRAYDYPSGYNLGIRPRQYEGISFEMLRGLADGFDLVRLCIETRKDQMAGLSGSVMPRLSAKDELRADPDDRCQRVEDFLRFPDGRLPFETWMRELLEQQLTIDAPAIYVRRDMGGEPYSLEVLDGTTIRPLLDATGRPPVAPAPAYQQILKGVPAIDYTADELLYMPRNPRVHKVYGCSPVEQIIMTVNIAIRREVAKLSYYTEGNIPEALISVPKEWGPEQVARFQATFDAYMTDEQARSKLKFVPGGMVYQPTRNDASLMSEVDEWLARVIVYAFSLPELPFVKTQNRATAETANSAALEQGLRPMMVWFKSVMDRIIQKVFGFADLEWVWDDIEEIDPKEQVAQSLQLVQYGIKSIDEVRAEMGLPPLGMGHAIWGIGPLGVMFIDDLLKAKAQGAGMPPTPMPPDAMGGMGQGAIGQGGPMIDGSAAPPAGMIAGPQGGGSGEAGPPDVGDALAGVPPDILAAVGLGPAGPQGRSIDVTAADQHGSDPLRHAVGDPHVLRTLREVEAMHGAKGQK